MSYLNRDGGILIPSNFFLSGFFVLETGNFLFLREPGARPKMRYPKRYNLHQEKYCHRFSGAIPITRIRYFRPADSSERGTGKRQIVKGKWFQ